MHDFRGKHAAQMNYSILSKKVSSLKDTDEGVDNMCKAVEEYGMELKEAGRVEGRADIIARMKASGMTDEQIERILSAKV